MGGAARAVSEGSADRPAALSAWPELSREEPFIFVTVGTDHHLFDRLMRWVDNWAREPEGPRLIVQSGTSSPPKRVPSQPYLDYEDMCAAIDGSIGVVCQGGPATIMEVRRSGRIPIVVPRRASLGEHVNDHQWLFSKRLAKESQIDLCETEDELRESMRRLIEDPASFRFEHGDQEHVSDAVAAFAALVDPLIAERRSRR